MGRADFVSSSGGVGDYIPMVQHPRILKLSNQSQFFGILVRNLRPRRMLQNLGRSTRRNLNFFVDVFLNVDRLGVFEGFQLVAHAGQPGGLRQITLAIPGRMSANGTGGPVGVQNVTPAGPRHYQRATPLNMNLVRLECGIAHLQIVGYKPTPNRQRCVRRRLAFQSRREHRNDPGSANG